MGTIRARTITEVATVGTANLLLVIISISTWDQPIHTTPQPMYLRIRMLVRKTIEEAELVEVNVFPCG